MKKRLMAMLVAAAMLVCMMPSMAFADEAPAEEQVVQATEEVVVPEAAEEEAVAPEAEGAVLEEEAVVEEAELNVFPQWGGYWSGSTFYFTGNEEGATTCELLANWSEITSYTIKVGANDMSSVLETLAPKSAYLSLCVTNADESFWRAQAFIMMKTKVAVDKAASKDTIFTYELDSVIAAQETKSGKIEYNVVDPSELTDYTFDLFGNTITLKAGETTAEGYLQLAVNTVEKEYHEAKAIPYGCLIKEKGNDGGYTTDTALGVWTQFSIGIDPEETGHLYGRFANRAEVQALFDELVENYDDSEAVLALLTSNFNLTEMTFTHTPAKGVQTGDSNSLGLWVVVMAVAGVAAAAVALKRREN